MDQLKALVAALSGVRLLFRYMAHFFTNKSDNKPLSDEVENEENYLLARAREYLAHSRVANFIISPNVSAVASIVGAVFMLGSPFIPVVGQALCATTIIAVAAGVMVNGHNLYKHKQIVSTYKALTEMLDSAEYNKKQLDNLPPQQQQWLRLIFKPKVFINEPVPPHSIHLASTWQRAAFRGMFNPAIVVTGVGAVCALSATSIAFAALSGLSTVIGLTEGEKERYDRKIKFMDAFTAVKQQLGCTDIASVIDIAKRIEAEKAAIEALTKNKAITIDALKEVYYEAYQKTEPLVKRATILNEIKGHIACSSQILYNGFSSKQVGSLYETPLIREGYRSDDVKTVRGKSLQATRLILPSKARNNLVASNKSQTSKRGKQEASNGIGL